MTTPGAPQTRRKRELHRATAEEARDALADARSFPTGTTVLSIHDIAAAVLGFDPRQGRHTDSRTVGETYSRKEKSADQLVNEHISLTALRRLLDDLVGEGIAARVTEPSPYVRDQQSRRLTRALVFRHGVKVGYVLVDRLEAELARVEAEARDARRIKLREQARFSLAERFQADYDAIYRDLADAEGLAPDPELPLEDGPFGRFLPKRASGAVVGAPAGGSPSSAVGDLDADGFYDPEAGAR